jgi:hypothetical protein
MRPPDSTTDAEDMVQDDAGHRSWSWRRLLAFGLGAVLIIGPVIAVIYAYVFYEPSPATRRPAGEVPSPFSTAPPPGPTARSN